MRNMTSATILYGWALRVGIFFNKKEFDTVVTLCYAVGKDENKRGVHLSDIFSSLVSYSSYNPNNVGKVSLAL